LPTRPPFRMGKAKDGPQLDDSEFQSDNEGDSDNEDDESIVLSE